MAVSTVYLDIYVHLLLETTIFYSNMIFYVIAVIDLIQSTESTDPRERHIHYYALSCVCNIIHGSDANRVLSIELKTISPVLSLLRYIQAVFA